jgi:Disulfide bond formation protein DsbB
MTQNPSPQNPSPLNPSTQKLTDLQTIFLARLINVVALLGLIGVLAGSLHLQIGIGEQPCPLCLIQRSAMIGLAVGPAMNLLWGMRPRHYALSMLAAVVGGAGSARQILLHIADPADPGYGPTVLGWHLYTWAFVTFLIGVVGMAVLLMWNRPFELTDQGVDKGILHKPGMLRGLSLFAIFWIFLDLLIVGISVLPECGLGMCPDDPPSTWSAGDINGWLLVLGVGGIAAIAAIIVNHKMSREDK